MKVSKKSRIFIILPSQYEFCASLVIELRGDIQTLRLGERIARVTTDGTITNFHLSKHQLNFQPMYFLPCWLHVSDRCLRPLRVAGLKFQLGYTKSLTVKPLTYVSLIH